MKIIGVSGKRESGKSSLARAMKKYGFIKVSLADPLKEMCKDLYGLTNGQVYGEFKESPTQYKRTDGSFYTPRDILIREGCLKRSIDPNFWCKKLEQTLVSGFCGGIDDRKFVIDDIRFLNEINYFKKFGAKFVRIERSDEAIGKKALDDLSETELNSYLDWDALLKSEFNRDLRDLDIFAEYLTLHV